MSTNGNRHKPSVAVRNRLPQIRTPLASDDNLLWKQFPQTKTLGSFGTSLLVHLVLLVVLALVTLTVFDNSKNVIEMSIGAVQGKEEPTTENSVIELPKTDEPVATKVEPPSRPTPVEKVGPKPKSHPLASRVDQLLSQSGIGRFGNLTGKGYGLGRDGEFAGSRILVWSGDATVIANIFIYDNPLWAALRKKGFEVTTRTSKFNPKWLQEADQLWIFSGNGRTPLGNEEYEAVMAFVRDGNGGRRGREFFRRSE